MNPIIIIAIGLVAAALTAWLISRRPRLTRRGGPLSTIKLKRGSQTDEELGRDGHALWYQLVHDGLNRRWQRLASRAAALRAVVTGAVEELVAALRAQADQLRLVRGNEDACQDLAKPIFSARALHRIYKGLLVGDIAVVSAAVMASEAETPILLAVFISLALSLTPFLLGKTVGDLGHDLINERAGRWMLGVGSLLLLFSASLMILRQGNVLAWLLLSLAPAMAAAGATVLGPRRAQLELERSRQDLKKATKTVGSRRARARKLAGRHNGIARLANAKLQQMASVVLSVQAQSGAISDASKAQSLEKVLRDLGVWVDEIDVNAVLAGAEQDVVADPDPLMPPAPRAPESAQPVVDLVSGNGNLAKAAPGDGVSFQ